MLPFRHVTFYAGLDGSMGDIVPVSEKVFRRLEMLQTLVQSHLPHYGGLNPREYRYVSALLIYLNVQVNNNPAVLANEL